MTFSHLRGSARRPGAASMKGGSRRAVTGGSQLAPGVAGQALMKGDSRKSRDPGSPDRARVGLRAQ